MSTALAKAFGNAEHLTAVARTKMHDSMGTLPSGWAGPAEMRSENTFGSADRQLSAMRGWVFACVRLISQRVAAQPICVGRERVAPTSHAGVTRKAIGDNSEPLDAHPLLTMLNHPNPGMSWWHLASVSVMSLELTGRALWWQTQENGQWRIYHIPSSWVVSRDWAKKTWRINARFGGGIHELHDAEIIHFYYPNPADPAGCMSPLQAMATAVNADDAIAKSQLAAFANGVNPSVALHVGRMAGADGKPGMRPQLTPEQRTQLVGAIKQAYAGVLNRGEPLILDGLIENITKLSMTPAEMDFLNSGRWTKEQICQGYGVNPILLGEVQGANRASAAVADSIFISSKIGPIVQMLSIVMTESLGPRFASPTEKIVVYIEPPVPNDPEMRLRKWQFAAQQRIVTPNEYRRVILNLPDMAGGDTWDDVDASPLPASVQKAAARIGDPYRKINGRANGNGHTGSIILQ